MAALVKEIMNCELYSVKTNEPVQQIRDQVLKLGITSVAVVDDAMMPVGMVSLRDLVARHGSTAVEVMSQPVVLIPATARITEAAEVLARKNLHRLIAVDSKGRAVGMVSALDVTRGLIGYPVSHPSSFPHFDEETQTVWSDDLVFDDDHVRQAPSMPGVLVMIHGVAGARETVVWAEASINVRSRLTELTNMGPGPVSLGGSIFGRPNLRFRCAAIASPSVRDRIARQLRSKRFARDLGTGAYPAVTHRH